MTRFQFAVVVLLLLAILTAQVWLMVNNTRPVIRPHVVPTRTPKLPDVFYERYRNEQGCNLDIEQTV